MSKVPYTCQEEVYPESPDPSPEHYQVANTNDVRRIRTFTHFTVTRHCVMMMMMMIMMTLYNTLARLYYADIIVTQYCNWRVGLRWYGFPTSQCFATTPYYIMTEVGDAWRYFRYTAKMLVFNLDSLFLGTLYFITSVPLFIIPV